MENCSKCDKSAELAADGLCLDCNLERLEGHGEVVPQPMSIAEIVAAFENAADEEEVFALLKEPTRRSIRSTSSSCATS